MHVIHADKLVNFSLPLQDRGRQGKKPALGRRAFVLVRGLLGGILAAAQSGKFAQTRQQHGSGGWQGDRGDGNAVHLETIRNPGAASAGEIGLGHLHQADLVKGTGRPAQGLPVLVLSRTPKSQEVFVPEFTASTSAASQWPLSPPPKVISTHRRCGRDRS